eukprot:7482737-Lingulodinium_polyedra.AAC.1
MARANATRAPRCAALQQRNAHLSTSLCNALDNALQRVQTHASSPQRDAMPRARARAPCAAQLHGVRLPRAW